MRDVEKNKGAETHVNPAARKVDDMSASKPCGEGQARAQRPEAGVSGAVRVWVCELEVNVFATVPITKKHTSHPHVRTTTPIGSEMHVTT